MRIHYVHNYEPKKTIVTIEQLDWMPVPRQGEIITIVVNSDGRNDYEVILVNWRYIGSAKTSLIIRVMQI